MPPEMRSVMGAAGSPGILWVSLLGGVQAKRRKGKTAWKMSRVEAAGESAVMEIWRACRSEGRRRGRNVSVSLGSEG